MSVKTRKDISMKPVKVMLAGIGGYGDGYLRRLFGLSDKGMAEVAGLIEPFPACCQRMDEVTRRGWKIFPSLDEFYKNNDCELAVISTPIQFHTRMIKKALSEGSSVLCEKPLTGDARDIDTLINARDRAGKFVMIGYQWSHSDAILSMKRDVLSGVYGKPEFLKTIVLWPRNKTYFKRGSGWAGKISDADGTLINDSVANNATAHYLHNIFFTLGKTLDTSLTPDTVKAELRRANPIENFDTAIIECGFTNGAKSLFIASHSTEKNLEPSFEYRFTNGTIEFDEGSGGHIIGKLNDGTSRDYGNPFADQLNKLDIAFNNVMKARNGEKAFVPCGIETASAQTLCIAECQKQEIKNFPEERKRLAEGELTYIDGLYDELISRYKKA